MKKYDFKKTEKKWQKKWLEEKAFRADEKSKKPKYYALETFPYPSAAGLHVGHPKGYIAEDIQARYHRMKGYEVLYTMGWDAFGLPTENYAIKVGKSPQEVAKENIANFKRQVQMFGLSYDWDREINTSSPEYYKWTQWLFIQLYKKGLAYRSVARVNWCPKDQTVLANEQVVNGKCERCGELVVQKEMTQWFFKISEYTEQLISGLKGLDWPSSTLKRQEDWIGKSEEAEIDFLLDFKKNPSDNDNRGPNGERAQLTVFTTRPDTLYGATYLVLAPEHLWVTLAIDDAHDVLFNKEEVKAYVEAASRKTELARQEGEQEKTGVEIKGVKAINPATKEEIPIWVADYVLGSYGTGAIMAVPAHDERDFAFAKKFDLPIICVIDPVDKETSLNLRLGSAEEDPQQVLRSIYQGERVYEGSGKLMNSKDFNGLWFDEAKWKITEAVGGRKKTQYRLRDWSVSRQRYWGVPIPIIHCEKCALENPSGQGIVPVPEKDLPVVLPDDVDYRPHGIPPLASSESFMNVKCPSCGGAAKREPETLDTFVDSSWYYLRYTDPHNDKNAFSKEKAKHWLPVDLYVIGAEHTVLHLLYSRFITKFLRDEGYFDFSEPFLKLRHQGLILGTDGQKMSKSKGNVVNPDEIVGEFGADTVRMYEMFMGPFQDGAPWDPKGILGVERFLRRFYAYIEEGIANPNNETSQSVRSLFEKTVKKIGEDIESFKFNTAISSLMILLNNLQEDSKEKILLSFIDMERLIKLLYPFAPHMAQELWEQMDPVAHKDQFLDFEMWPEVDEEFLKDDTFQLVVQVNGKVRANIEVPTGIDEQEASALVLRDPRMKVFLENATIKKVIFVPNRLINYVL